MSKTKPISWTKALSARFAEIDFPASRETEAVIRLMQGDILVRQRFRNRRLNRTGWCRPDQTQADLIRMISTDPRSHE